MTPGIHLLHKPAGPTSFSLVREFAGAMQTAAASHAPARRRRRICHGGVLDPFASGLVLILVEPATRLFDHLHDIPKTYRATIRWGIETDNGDPTGRPIATGNAESLRADQLETALQAFIGWHEQVPPATSNKRIGGERAYAKAHRGETVALPPQRVYLHGARWLRHELPIWSEVELVVRGGYYVRALARDLGQRLKCRAHLSRLHRLAIGPWNDPGEGQQVAISGAAVLPWAPRRILSDQEVGALRAGRSIPAEALQPPEWRVPEGFPPPDPPILGIHQQRLRFLLSPEHPSSGPPRLIGRAYAG
jgi:tRNA pseudouridine55 synthase